jgi:hypothetical protein
MLSPLPWQVPWPGVPSAPSGLQPGSLAVDCTSSSGEGGLEPARSPAPPGRHRNKPAAPAWVRRWEMLVEGRAGAENPLPSQVHGGQGHRGCHSLSVVLSTLPG